MTDTTISRVEILIQQGKYPEAERMLKDLLAMDAGNLHYQCLLAEVFLAQDKTEEANTIISNAIGMNPDNGYLFYIKARIDISKDDFDSAEKNSMQSITLDPHDADYFAMYANIKLARKKYSEALEYANKALEIDPENILALNTRSTALLKLNKKSESFQTIEGALRNDPNNSYTHANYGWGLLEKGEHKKALEHFRESLKNDPTSEYAKAGMMEALKASNPIYRLFLKYSFFMSNLTAKYQWGVILSFYFGQKILRGIARTSPTLDSYIKPVIIGMAIIAFSTWVITPISNLFLRFNVYGNFLLDKDEKRSSNFVAVSLGIFLLGLLLYIVFSNDMFLSLAVFGFAMMLPFSVMFAPSKYKNALLIYSGIMTITGIASLLIIFNTGNLFNMFTMIFGFGFIAFQWIANGLMIQQSNK